MEAVSYRYCQWSRIKCIPESSLQTVLLAKVTSGWESHYHYQISAGLPTQVPADAVPQGRPGSPRIRLSSQPCQGVSSTLPRWLSIEIQVRHGIVSCRACRSRFGDVWDLGTLVCLVLKRKKSVVLWPSGHFFPQNKIKASNLSFANRSWKLVFLVWSNCAVGDWYSSCNTLQSLFSFFFPLSYFFSLWHPTLDIYIYIWLLKKQPEVWFSIAQCIWLQ